jgi:hypothetical protein
MIPKRTPLFVHISDPQMDTLYSSISVIPKWTPYFVYISDFKMATLCLSLSVTPNEVSWILDLPPEIFYAAQEIRI